MKPEGVLECVIQTIMMQQWSESVWMVNWFALARCVSSEKNNQFLVCNSIDAGNVCQKLVSTGNVHWVSTKHPSAVQHVELSAQTPFPFCPQTWPKFLHKCGLYASSMHRLAAGPPMLHPINGEQQILAPKQRPDRPGPHRVHWKTTENKIKLRSFKPILTSFPIESCLVDNATAKADGWDDRLPPGGQLVMKQASHPITTMVATIIKLKWYDCIVLASGDGHTNSID